MKDMKNNHHFFSSGNEDVYTGCVFYPVNCWIRWLCLVLDSVWSKGYKCGVEKLFGSLVGKRDCVKSVCVNHVYLVQYSCLCAHSYTHLHIIHTNTHTIHTHTQYMHTPKSTRRNWREREEKGSIPILWGTNDQTKTSNGRSLTFTSRLATDHFHGFTTITARFSKPSSHHR